MYILRFNNDIVSLIVDYLDLKSAYYFTSTNKRMYDRFMNNDGIPLTLFQVKIIKDQNKLLNDLSTIIEYTKYYKENTLQIEYPVFYRYSELQIPKIFYQVVYSNDYPDKNMAKYSPQYAISQLNHYNNACSTKFLSTNLIMSFNCCIKYCKYSELTEQESDQSLKYIIDSTSGEYNISNEPTQSNISINLNKNSFYNLNYGEKDQNDLYRASWIYGFFGKYSLYRFTCPVKSMMIYSSEYYVNTQNESEHNASGEDRIKSFPICDRYKNIRDYAEFLQEFKSEIAYLGIISKFSNNEKLVYFCREFNMDTLQQFTKLITPNHDRDYEIVAIWFELHQKNQSFDIKTQEQLDNSLQPILYIYYFKTYTDEFYIELRNHVYSKSLVYQAINGYMKEWENEPNLDVFPFVPCGYYADPTGFFETKTNKSNESNQNLLTYPIKYRKFPYYDKDSQGEIINFQYIKENDSDLDDSDVYDEESEYSEDEYAQYDINKIMRQLKKAGIYIENVNHNLGNENIDENNIYEQEDNKYIDDNFDDESENEDDPVYNYCNTDVDQYVDDIIESAKNDKIEDDRIYKENCDELMHEVYRNQNYKYNSYELNYDSKVIDEIIEEYSDVDNQNFEIDQSEIMDKNIIIQNNKYVKQEENPFMICVLEKIKLKSDSIMKENKDIEKMTCNLSEELVESNLIKKDKDDYYNNIICGSIIGGCTILIMYGVYKYMKK